MKANHNFGNVMLHLFGAVINISKIQNESKSQQHLKEAIKDGSCYQYFKDTK